MSYGFWIQLHFTENEKIEYILNHEYFGMGCNGASCAAQRFFGKKLNDLTPDESELLIKFLKNPARYIKAVEKDFGKNVIELTPEDKAKAAKMIREGTL